MAYKNLLHTLSKPRYNTIMPNHHRFPSGPLHPLHKLTWPQVRQLRALYPTQSIRAISRLYNLDYHTVWNIIHQKTWKEPTHDDQD